MRILPFALALAAGLSLGVSAKADAPENLVSHADFDFYILALSWSPGFCDSEAADQTSDQCAVGAGQGFVVHGLWPENASRPYPADCDDKVYVPGAALRLTHGVYPSEKLAIHEYRKHGSCTGLTPDVYFTAAKYARDHFTIPPLLQAPREPISTSPHEIETTLIAANPGLTSQNFALSCSNGELTDIRICIPKTLDGYVDCRRVASHSCHADSIIVAPLR